MRPFQSALLGPSLSGPGEGEPMVMGMAIGMAASLAGLALLLMLLLLLLLFVLACRPWRFFLSSSSSVSRTAIAAVKPDDLDRPLFAENLDQPSEQSYDLVRSYGQESLIQIDGNTSSPRAHGRVSKKRVQPTDSYGSQGDSLILDVVTESSDDLQFGQTLKRTVVPNWPVENIKDVRRESSYNVEFISDNERNLASAFKDISFIQSSLTLEVIAGPSTGLSCSRQSANISMLPLTLGRVSPSDLLLKDSEVSGKHARINWNINKLKWELVDMGSLNGTYLNSQVVHHPDFNSRHWSEPVELEDGDIITLGTSSRLSVQISRHVECGIPVGVGIASDPMARRQGGKRLPMEDMCICQWPLPNVEQFGLFGIFDGHGGVGAAKSASKMLPENVAKILFHPERRERVLSCCDASDVLRDAFALTEAAMHHQYEGCTATILLIWLDHKKEFFAQCANVGDSACIMNVDGKQIAMTEDHRVTSQSERTRLIKAGKPLKDGEGRLCGLNISRMLGDKFLKEQDMRFSAEPFVSQVVQITKTCMAFGLMASDGLWDVISTKRAVQLVLQMKERYNASDENSANRIANDVLNEARTLRTKDNTSVIFLDFDTLRTDSCRIDL
ncbi:protein phosphatase 2C 70 [Elaeis guineensis]|uniref:protein-serine/threonine phosphatase n=1 Tax=Elaeis guineensis var. tenera TaxID=51953 RepID=A0A6I9RT47_ELAGV|nr:protein phosphatase 2C 70 [Elaeis guineensis]